MRIVHTGAVTWHAGGNDENLWQSQNFLFMGFSAIFHKNFEP